MPIVRKMLLRITVKEDNAEELSSRESMQNIRIRELQLNKVDPSEHQTIAPESVHPQDTCVREARLCGFLAKEALTCDAVIVAKFLNFEKKGLFTGACVKWCKFHVM